MVLDEFERRAGVEEMRRDRVPERVAGVVGGELRAVPVPGEECLNLTLPQCPTPTSEERTLRRALVTAKMTSEEIHRRREERPLAPRTALHALHNDALALEIDV